MAGIASYCRAALAAVALLCTAVSPASARQRPPAHKGGSTRTDKAGVRKTPSRVQASIAKPTIAWFCQGPPAQACPPQVHIQIIGEYIYRDGARIGRYVDNEDPTQQQDVAVYRSQGTAFVLAGIAEGDAGRRVTGAVNALEWYPWPAWGLETAPPRGYPAYILQAGFSWPSSRAPTAAEIKRSYCGTLADRPQLIAFYYWTPAAWAAVNGAKCGRNDAPARRARLQLRRHGDTAPRMRTKVYRFDVRVPEVPWLSMH
jgi:hypothetical protein